MRRQKLKNKAAYGAKVMKMDDQVYALRRKVIDAIYEVKRRGYDLPRIEVRVVEGTEGATAYAYTGRNIIHVDKRWIDQDIQIRTMHEIGHATFGVGRVPGCLLMDCEDWTRYSVDPEKIFKIFDKYYKKYTKTK